MIIITTILLCIYTTIYTTMYTTMYYKKKEEREEERRNNILFFPFFSLIVMIEKHKCQLNLTNEKNPSCTICGKNNVLEPSKFLQSLWNNNH